MIEEVKEFFGDVKESVGGNGFVIIIIAIVGVFLYNLMKSDSSDGEVYYTPSGVAGYPGLEQNADVVIDTVTNNMQGYYNDLLNVMQEHDKESTSSILGALTDSESNIKGSIENAKEELTDNMGLGFDTVHLGFETVENYINESMSKVEDLSAKVDNIDNTPRVEYVTQYVPQYITVPSETEKTVSTEKITAPTVNNNSTVVPVVSGGVKGSIGEPQKVADTYQYKTKSGLNTNASLVDALKAIGEDSSMKNRKKIAEANGMTNYQGSYSQNVALLKKLKAGELKKVG